MAWRRDEYRHGRTHKLLGIEIVPIDDLREHISDETCECLPVEDAQDGTPRLTHHAFDGREFSEPEHAEAAH